MDAVDLALAEFGLPAPPSARVELRRRLEAQIQLEENDAGHQPLMRLLCAMLFSIGVVEDSLLIWRAKSCCFDTMCGIDVQFLCGAGLSATEAFLEASATGDAKEALTYLRECTQSGDFDEFSVSQTVVYARLYYLDDGGREGGPRTERLGPLRTTKTSSGSARACRGPGPARRGNRPAPG